MRHFQFWGVQEVKQRDLEHQEALQKTRRGDKSDAILRSDLLNLERRLAILTNELKETERHLGRHSSTGSHVAYRLSPFQ